MYSAGEQHYQLSVRVFWGKSGKGREKVLIL